MTPAFEFATAPRILFGAGTVREVPKLAASMGHRALVVTGSNQGRADALRRAIDIEGVGHATLRIGGEPTTTVVEDGLSMARGQGCDLVIAVGGGSALDSGKAIAALLTNPGKLTDYLEVIGRGMQLEQPSAPFIAVPTTAGTGSEATRNAVLESPEHRVKVSMRSPFMLPRVAVVDPELALTLPPGVTAATGLDALTQLLEAFVSSKASPFTDGFCREGLARGARALPVAFRNGEDLEARADMALASLFSGIALANAGLGAVHGFAGSLGGLLGAPHGALCATLLPHVMNGNIRALQARQPDSPALSRYDEVARIVTGIAGARAVDAVKWARELCAALAIPPLSALGMTEKEIPAAVDKARNARSMKGNPVTLTDNELTEILSRAM